jgi:hypothetical protein
MRPALSSPKTPLVRRLALAMDDVAEVRSYGTPGFKVRGRLFSRLHQDGASLVVAMDVLERDLAMRAEPDVYFLTDHYTPYPWVLVHLAAVETGQLRKILERARAFVAPPVAGAARKSPSRPSTAPRSSPRPRRRLTRRFPSR